MREKLLNALPTLRAFARYFEIPGVKEDYEKWLIEYKKGRKNRDAENRI